MKLNYLLALLICLSLSCKESGKLNENKEEQLSTQSLEDQYFKTDRIRLRKAAPIRKKLKRKR